VQSELATHTRARVRMAEVTVPGRFPRDLRSDDGREAASRRSGLRASRPSPTYARSRGPRRVHGWTKRPRGASHGVAPRARSAAGIAQEGGMGAAHHLGILEKPVSEATPRTMPSKTVSLGARSVASVQQ
jgi:hypothetical protein